MSAPASGFHLKPLHKVSVNFYGFYFNCLSPVLWDAKHQLWTCTTETHAMTIKTNSPACESLREQQSVGCQYSTCWGQPRDFPTPPQEVGSSLASKPHSSWLLEGSDSISPGTTIKNGQFSVSGVINTRDNTITKQSLHQQFCAWR